MLPQTKLHAVLRLITKKLNFFAIFSGFYRLLKPERFILQIRLSTFACVIAVICFAGTVISAKSGWTEIKNMQQKDKSKIRERRVQKQKPGNFNQRLSLRSPVPVIFPHAAIIIINYQTSVNNNEC